MKFRPWGSLEWVLSLSDQLHWHFVGALGTEERSICSWSMLKLMGVLSGESLVKISDTFSSKYCDNIDKLSKVRHQQFIDRGGPEQSLKSMNLMDEMFKIQDFANNVVHGESSIILDITSLPKRYYFPILKDLLKNTEVKNLVITYTAPSFYADDGEPLYENLGEWQTLPGFNGGSSPADTWVVSVGFLVGSLRRYLEDNPSERMKVLLPFPAPLVEIRRMWEAVAVLENEQPVDRLEKIRVDALDLSAAFDVLTRIGRSLPLAFAPFGPKPTAAAMCLYAIQTSSNVYYAQPTVYHPDYSKGIRNDSPNDAISAYWVKHDGENLYAL